MADSGSPPQSPDDDTPEALENSRARNLQGLLLDYQEPDVISQIYTAVALTDEDFQYFHEHADYGWNITQWPAWLQIRWIVTRPEEERLNYVSAATRRAYEAWLDEQRQQQQQQEEGGQPANVTADETFQRALQNVTQVDEDTTAWASAQYGEDPMAWPLHLRLRWIANQANQRVELTSVPRVQTPAEASSSQRPRKRLPDARPRRSPSPTDPESESCLGCRGTSHEGSCNAEVDAGVGCSACRDRNQQCTVGSSGNVLARRPFRDVSFFHCRLIPDSLPACFRACRLDGPDRECWPGNGDL